MKGGISSFQRARLGKIETCHDSPPRPFLRIQRFFSIKTGCHDRFMGFIVKNNRILLYFHNEEGVMSVVESI